MQFAEFAIDKVEEFITIHDPDFLDSAKCSFDTIRALIKEQDLSFFDPSIQPDYATWTEEANKVINHLIQMKDTYLITIDEMKVEWVIQDATIVLQSASQHLRDQHMAANVSWILEHSNPGSKIVLWAHNGHVNKRDGYMGDYLYQKYNENMKVFGFCFHEGYYTARGDRGLVTYIANPSDYGSFEYAFHRTESSRFMLDLEKVSYSDSVSSWLTEEHEFRNIGARAMNWGFVPTEIISLYDALVYLDKTNASVLLNK